MKNVHPATKPVMPRPAYIHTRYGSCDTGLSAMQMAAAMPIVIQKSAEMNDRKLSHVSDCPSTIGRKTHTFSALV
jgi:hypothetical protein